MDLARRALWTDCCKFDVSVSEEGKASCWFSPSKVFSEFLFPKRDADKIASADAGDATFARRVYLDLVGTIPSPDQARQFLADESPDKRSRLIDQLLHNIVSNAVKFNNPGGRVDITMLLGRNDTIVIDVMDTGIGIPKSEIANVTKPFVQLSPVYGREYEGIDRERIRESLINRRLNMLARRYLRDLRRSASVDIRQ